MAITDGPVALREHAERIGLDHEVEDPLKVRVGLGLGTNLGDALDGATFWEIIDACEGVGLDSIWFSERLAGPLPSPMVLMAAVAGRTRRLRFGTSAMILPGRDPVLLAKELATLDVVSDGRVIPIFGLVNARSGDRALLRVPHGAAGRWADEALGLLRRLWTEPEVTHAGEFFTLDGVSVGPRPVQRPHPDVWTGGHSRAARSRAGRLADGWLPSFLPPSAYLEAAREILEVAAVSGRRWDLGHFGMVVPYVPRGRDDAAEVAIAALARRIENGDPQTVMVTDPTALQARLEEYVEAGASKFVAVPIVAPHQWGEEVAWLREEVAAPLAGQTIRV